METVVNKRFVYEFGQFVLDPEEKTLFSDGVPLHLPAKEFETLLLLVENNGRALSKDEMIAAIWRDSFVEEGNLTKQISRLRKIFNGEGRATIETLPKHGYRFSADLRLTEHPVADPITVEKRTVKRVTLAYSQDVSDALMSYETKRLMPSGSRRQRLIVAACVLLLGVAGAVSYFRFSSQPNQLDNVSAVKSVAVLPFRPVGAEESDEYLRLGLTDALITKLSGLKRIVVRPTNAVRNFGSHDPLSAGGQLKVDAVLDGNVQRVGDQVRVTVQLVSVRDGSLLWAGKFDEQFTNIFVVQDQISEQVARALMPSLSSAEEELLTKHYTENSEAYQLYLKGRFFWNKRTVEGLNKGIGYFNEAVEKDPFFALAYVGLADSYSLLSDYGGLPPKQVYPQAKKAALRALELDERLAEAHAALAFIKAAYDWDWTGAEMEYRRAIELNPNYETAHQWYAEYLSAMGRHEEAIAEIGRAKEINPTSLIINAVEVWILYHARKYDEGIAQAHKVIEMDSRFAEAYQYLKICYDQKGMYREAITARQMRRKLAGLDAKVTEALREAAAAKTAGVYWQKRLEQEIEESKRELSTAFDMAELYAQLGEKEQAFAWLEKAYEERYFALMYLKVSPGFDLLRSDPRFADLLLRVGLSS